MKERQSQRGTRTKAWPFILAGVVVVIAVLIFDVAWLSFSTKESDHLVFDVNIDPATSSPYSVTLPTLIDGNGIETAVGGGIVAQPPAQLNHINTPSGMALLLTSSGPVELQVDINDWGGFPSMTLFGSKAQVSVRLNASTNFAIRIDIGWSYDHESEQVNMFGAEEGPFGGSHGRFNVTGSFSSTSDWVVMEGPCEGMYYDGSGNAVRDGAIVSVVGCIVGVILVAVGIREKELHPHG